MNYTTRRSTSKDFESLLFLIKEFSVFQKTPEKVSITLPRMMANEHLFQCFVAEDEGGVIIGFASFFFAYFSWSGKAICLDDLYVKQDSRKKGIGKMLLAEVMALAKETGCKKVRWQVSKWNTNAINFYKSIGAAIDDTEINCDFIVNQPE